MPHSTVSTSVIIKHKSSLLGSIKEGFGWGIGTAVARTLFGGSSAQPTDFEQCIAEHKDDIALCAHLAQKK